MYAVCGVYAAYAVYAVYAVCAAYAVYAVYAVYVVYRRLGEAFSVDSDREIVSPRSLARTHARKINARGNVTRVDLSNSFRGDGDVRATRSKIKGKDRFLSLIFDLVARGV